MSELRRQLDAISCHERVVRRAEHPSPHLGPDLEYLACEWPHRRRGHSRETSRASLRLPCEDLGLFARAELCKHICQRGQSHAIPAPHQHCLFAYQATTPVAQTNVEVARPDALVHPHTFRDELCVGPDALADARDLVDEGDAR